MAKYKQECIFGIRAVIEAIQQEKEIDKVMLKQGVRGELFQQLFSLIRERNIPFQYVPMFLSLSPIGIIRGYWLKYHLFPIRI